MSRKPTANIDYTSRDYEAYRELMIQKLREKMPEYTDISETDAGIVILEALANGLDILSLYADVIANDVLLPTTQDRKLAVLHAKCLGYTPYNQTASEYPQVFVLNGVRDTNTIIPKGTVVKTKESSDLATLYFETIEDFVIPKGKLGNEQDAQGNYLYTVKIQNGTSVYQDVVGTSTGASLQSFKLKYTNVLIDSIELYINEGSGQYLWTRVDNFIDADENSRVYTVSVDDFDVCSIEFGNGFKGKIPTVYQNGIVANYRIGGGEAGNVGAGIICELDSSIAYVATTFNLEATKRGHNKESLDSIKVNAPASFRTRDRIVTLDDYSDLLKLNFYDFLDVKTLRDSTDRKKALIYYRMKDGYAIYNIQDEVVAFIAKRIMAGTSFELKVPNRNVVSLNCNMYVDSSYDKDKLVANVETYLKDVVFNYNNIVFGYSIVKSDVENEIKNTFEGILSFRITEPTTDIITTTREENILELGTVNITVNTL